MYTIELDCPPGGLRPDRKSTRLNSSHGYISYAVFCLKKKNHKMLAPHAFAGAFLLVASLQCAAAIPNGLQREWDQNPNGLRDEFFFFNVPPPPDIYPLSLHDALPICEGHGVGHGRQSARARFGAVLHHQAS